MIKTFYGGYVFDSESVTRRKNVCVTICDKKRVRQKHIKWLQPIEESYDSNPITFYAFIIIFESMQLIKSMQLREVVEFDSVINMVTAMLGIKLNIKLQMAIYFTWNKIR